MAVLRPLSRLAVVFPLLVLCAGIDGIRQARADRIMLRGGGQVRGKVVPDPKHPDRVTVLTETGKTPLSFQKPQVLRVIAEPSPLDEYVTRRAKLTKDAEAQYQLGLWCEAHKLQDLASIHYEAAVAQDKSFAPAHQKLGHALQGDTWLTSDQVREAQGLVRYKGRWVAKEERDRAEAFKAFNAEQNSWARRIRMLREALLFAPEQRRREAEKQLLEIREPTAVAPLVRIFGQDIGELRMLLDQILGLIPGPEATAALISRILFETDSEVRQATLTELTRREDSIIVPNLVKALRSSQPEVVNRAAWTLAHLDAVSTVPKLIPALITIQYRVVMVSSGGSGGGGGSYTGPTVPALGAVPVYTNGSSTAFLTPPAVGPGVVAYGATQVPYSAYSGVSLSAGGGNASSSPGPVPKILAFSYQNVEVLAALVKMTGNDFGYDIPAWKHWVSTSFRADRAPARRVPQP